MATSKKAEDRVPKGSRKSLKDMSESHRAHVLFWEPHLDNLRAEFVWIAVSRFPERGGEGPHYVAVKRGEKDYAIIDYDTSNPKKTDKRHVLDEGFTSSTAMLEAFKAYRQKAREERAAASAEKAAKPKKKQVRKTTTSKSKSAPKKGGAKSSTSKNTPAKKKAATRKRKPAKS